MPASPHETPRGARQSPTEAQLVLSVCDLEDGAIPLVTWSEITKRPGGVNPLARGKFLRGRIDTPTETGGVNPLARSKFLRGRIDTSTETGGVNPLARKV